MKKIFFVPIRTKILATLLILTIGVLIASLYTSRTLLQNDKMAYLFDFNQEAAQSKSVIVNSLLQQWEQGVMALTLYVDPKSSSLGSIGEILFQQIKDLQAMIVVQDSSLPTIEPLLEKAKSFTAEEAKDFRQWAMAQRQKAGASSRVQILNNPLRVRIALKKHQQDRSEQAVFFVFQINAQKLEPLFFAESETRSILVDQQMLPLVTQKKDDVQLWDQLQGAAHFSGLHNISQLVRANSGSYLTTLVRLESYPFFIATMTPEGVVSRVLQELTFKTFYVAALALFIVVILGILFSKSLTVNIDRLLRAVSQVSEGDFNVNLKISSRDETRQLAEGFQTMSHEIRRLLNETAEKSRMEIELKTAQAVQATLFPDGNLNWNGFDIVGMYRSASECGGDWWYYKTSGRYIYLVVADATGHGASAAMITSAARSALSLVANHEPPPLEEVVQALNRAIFETSKGQLMMTAVFIRVDSKTGAVELANCSHEYPYLLDREAADPVQCLVFDSNPRLGQRAEIEVKKDHFSIREGQTLVLFTDGWPDVRSPDGKSLQERRVLKALRKSTGSAAHILEQLTNEMDQFSQGAPYHDDVTIVLIQRTGLRPEIAVAP